MIQRPSPTRPVPPPAPIRIRQLAMGTQMAGRLARHDWSSTALGPMASWSPALCTAIDLCLGSRMCSCIYWGEDHLILYNDAYSTILGTKHPWALGRPAREAWSEIYDVIGPLMERTYRSGETTGGDDMAIFLNRSGYVEEFYCSFTYTPLINHDGIIEGVFATLPETSVRVIAERRLRTLQKLGCDARESRQPRDTLRIAADVMAENPYDIPFAALYGWRDDDSCAELFATANVTAGMALCPARLDLDGDHELAGVVRTARRAGHALLPLRERHLPVPLGAWQVPANEVIVLPLQPYGDDPLNAVMLAGVSPLKRLDDDHLTFFRMLADQISRLLAEAITHEHEDARVRALQQRARAEQHAQRVRIARDMHDTLLQSMQGMRFLIEAGLASMRSGEPGTEVHFEHALEASVQAIAEGREVLSLLRSTAPMTDSVKASLHELGEEIVAPGGSGIAFSVDVSGTPQPLDAEVWNETYILCREALTNALRHAQASMVRVQVRYVDPLTVVIEDDGRGIDATVAQYGRAGHFGLQGMRERAAGMGGTLDIASGEGSGTSIVLTVPGSNAYSAREAL